MKIIIKTFIISLLTLNFSFAQWDGTYKTEGSEAGRATLTISNGANQYHVGYVDGNYKSFSSDGSLQNPSLNSYKSSETLGCGSLTERSQLVAEIATRKTKTQKEINLIFRYCEGGKPKRVEKNFTATLDNIKRN